MLEVNLQGEVIKGGKLIPLWYLSGGPLGDDQDEVISIEPSD